MVFKCLENKIVFLKKYRKNWTSIGTHTRYSYMMYPLDYSIYQIQSINIYININLYRNIYIYRNNFH